MTDRPTPPLWFKIVAVLALLWNLMGLMAFVMGLDLSEETLSGYSEAMQQLYREAPMWNWIAYGLAVVTGFLGAIMLVIRRRWARLLFTLSLVGILFQNSYTFVVSDVGSMLEPGEYVMPTLVTGIGIILLFLSKRAEASGWIK